MPFVANYSGICFTCEERFPAGEKITYTDDGDIAHVECEERGEPPVRRMPAVCSKCFIAHAGECF